MSTLATKDNFDRYLSPNFIYTYLQFRLKYFIHDKMLSPDYRKHKVMWDGFLTGLEVAYITGLAKLVLPLAKSKNGKQRYPSQIAIETWMPGFKVKNPKAEEHIKEWRHKALVHIDTGMVGTADRTLMSSLMDEAIEAIVTISKIYYPNIDYKSELEEIGKESEEDFLRLLEIIKKGNRLA